MTDRSGAPAAGDGALSPKGGRMSSSVVVAFGQASRRIWETAARTMIR
ncbi:hypothetical protein [Streptomyces sp. NPDC004589]